MTRASAATSPPARALAASSDAPIARAEAAAWTAPPHPFKSAGKPRRIGVEIEFGGVDADQAADAVREIFGGRIARRSDWRVDVEGGPCGDFRCELDVKFAHRETRGETPRRLRDAAAAVGATVLPMEITCPPLALVDAPRLDALGNALAAQGAFGTGAGPLYAFGLQLNPELPSLAPADILATLRAYLTLGPWLRARLDVDLSRRLWSFEAAFPDEFRDLVLDPLFAPDQAALIDAYLRANPSRNRELDLLPLLAHLDEPRVRAALPAETIKPRPTWHWRLPDCRLDEPGWSISAVWARWAAVERLAADPERLAHAARIARDTPGSDALLALGDALCDPT